MATTLVVGFPPASRKQEWQVKWNKFDNLSAIKSGQREAKNLIVTMLRLTRLTSNLMVLSTPCRNHAWPTASSAGPQVLMSQAFTQLGYMLQKWHGMPLQTREAWLNGLFLIISPSLVHLELKIITKHVQHAKACRTWQVSQIISFGWRACMPSTNLFSVHTWSSISSG